MFAGKILKWLIQNAIKFAKLNNFLIIDTIDNHFKQKNTCFKIFDLTLK